jgi:hypothetical protein
VSLLDSVKYQDPLDLLHRFIPTPFRTRFRVGETTVRVETNDFSLLPELPLETEFNLFSSLDILWRVVRDFDAPGHLEEPLQLVSGPLTIVSMGTGCLLGADRERGELFAFIGASVDPRTFHDSLVPLLCRMSFKSNEVDHEIWPDTRSEDGHDG